MRMKKKKWKGMREKTVKKGWEGERRGEKSTQGGEEDEDSEEELRTGNEIKKRSVRGRYAQMKT